MCAYENLEGLQVFSIHKSGLVDSYVGVVWSRDATPHDMQHVSGMHAMRASLSLAMLSLSLDPAVSRLSTRPFTRYVFGLACLTHAPPNAAS